MESGTIKSFLSVRKRTRNEDYKTKQKDSINKAHSLKKTRSDTDLSIDTVPGTETTRRYATRTSLRQRKSVIDTPATIKVAPVKLVQKNTTAKKSSTVLDSLKKASLKSIKKLTKNENDKEIVVELPSSQKDTSSTVEVEKAKEIIEHLKEPTKLIISELDTPTIVDKEDEVPLNKSNSEEEEEEEETSTVDKEITSNTKASAIATTSTSIKVNVNDPSISAALNATTDSTPISKSKETLITVEDTTASLTPPQLIPEKPRIFTAASSSIQRPSAPAARYTPLLKGPPLPWPDHYEVLMRILAALDHTILFMRGQRQRSIYHKIRPSVEEMCRRQFELRHLAQLVTIFPEAYILDAASIVANGERIPSVSIDLPNTELLSTAPSSSAATSSTNPQPARDLLTRRRDQLREKLLDRLEQHHNEFLKLQNTTISSVQTWPIAWHQDFDLNTVTEIEQATLPLPIDVPIAKARRLQLFGRKKTSTAEVISSTTKDSTSTPFLPSSTSSEASEANATTTTTTTTTTTIKPVGKGIAARAAALLDRIRQKSKQRGSITLAEESAQSRQKALNSRLPMVVDALAFMASSLGKRVLPLKDVARRLSNSTEDSLISEGEAYELVKRCTELAPNWCGLTTTAGVAYVHIHRPLDTTQIKQELLQATLNDTTPTMH